MFKRKNLLVLAYASNECYTALVRLSELEEAAKRMNSVNSNDLTINLKDGIWSFGQWHDFPIGQGRLRQPNHSRSGIIGVYDFSVYEHISRLVNDAQQAVEKPLQGHALSED
jgi:hypothetical protein